MSNSRNGSALHDVTLVGAGGEYMDAAVLVEWLVSPGALVSNGQPLAVVETAKAATEVTASAPGVIHELLAKAGEEIKVGAVLARIARDDAEPGSPASPAVVPSPAQVPVGENSALVRRLPQAFASPLAKRLARDRDLDLATLKGSGPRGRIIRADVERAPGAQTLALNAPSLTTPASGAQASAGSQPSSAAGGEGYRRAMAAHMVRAAAIPAFTIAMEIDGTALFAARAAIKRQAGRASVNDLIIAAVARALRAHPRVNARWDGNGVLFNADINIGVAIATDLGLVVPVLHRADGLDIESVGRQVSDLKIKAQSQRLSPAEIVGATFTISNLGSFGVSGFTAALNPPAAAILAVPAFRPVTVFQASKLESRLLAQFSITADHRVLDGADVARFLQTLKIDLEAEGPAAS